MKRLKPVVIGSGLATAAWTRFCWDTNSGGGFNNAVIWSVPMAYVTYKLYKSENPSLIWKVLGWGATIAVLGGIASFNKEYGTNHTIFG
jgi:hypothetical protein